MMESDIFRIICDNQGAVDTDYLIYNLGLGDSMNEIISNGDKFALCCPFGQPKVVARTRLRLCRAKDCPGSCRGLHLCKKFLFSRSCRFSGTRRGCKFSHDLDSFHNAPLLREHQLESLSWTELRTLLLQSDNWLLPQSMDAHSLGMTIKETSRCIGLERLMYIANGKQKYFYTLWEPYVTVMTDENICHNYNNGGGEFGLCGDGHGCNRLHICEKYMNRDCRCSKSHDFKAPQPYKILQERGVPDELIQSLKSVYANILALKYVDRGNREQQQLNPPTTAVGSDDGQNKKQKPTKTNVGGARPTADVPGAANDGVDGPSRRQRPGPVRDKTEICMFFIKGHCIHDEERCYKVHSKLPYRWEVREDDKWTALPDNETIEKDYCDPKNTCSGSSLPVHFDTMTRGSNKVRRLSTINSVQSGDTTLVHATVWVWYWEDEAGKWNEYASTAGGHSMADMDSHKLEQKFLANDKDVVDFNAGSQSYSLSFQDMIQTNKRYSTKRLVKRRPQFVSTADVQNKRVRRPAGQANFTAMPNHWDKAQLPETGFKRVPLQRSSDEFKKIETLFCQTMRGFDIVKIERIQNKPLWEVFQWQKNQMEKNNKGRNVTEKQLFHGTDSKYVDVICHTNFDWRVCGVNGTAFGEGSYFARDAKYSHSYTGTADVKSMFISRVLVGDYTRGSSSYRRPPSKDGGDINFFDSCVDDVMNPSIFVVFEKHQIYPEYLLQYKTMHPLVASLSPAAVPATAPAPTLRPAAQPSVSVYQLGVSVAKPSTPSYQPSTTSYQPSTAVTQPSTAVPKPSTPSYQPSTAVPKPSTPSYQPSTPSFRSSTGVPLRSTSSYHTSTAVTQPSTPSYQPSTSSFRFSPAVTPPSRRIIQPAMASPLHSPPTPPPKKNDSCVIA